MGIQMAMEGSIVPRGNGFVPNAQHKGSREPVKRPDILGVSSELERVSLVFNKKLRFVVDHESHNIIVKVIDRATDKVIKVFPPEELQRLRDSIKETIGVLFDEKV